MVLVDSLQARTAVALVLTLSFPIAATAGKDNENAIRKGEGGYLSTPCDFIPDGAAIGDGAGGLTMNGKPVPDPTSVAPCLDYYVVRGVKHPKRSGDPVEVQVRHGGMSEKKLLFRTASPLAAFQRLFLSDEEKERVERVYRERARDALRQKTRAAMFNEGHSRRSATRRRIRS